MREVAVIGIPDEKWGELVTALVVTDGTRRHAPSDADRALPRSRWPATSARSGSSSSTELPRTATGKLQKFKLREQFWAGYDRQVN